MTSDTELKLSFWREGPIKAERLAGAALRLSGFEEIDPQTPLGGPDGKKDLICQKGGLAWIAAVYFPTGPVSFAKLKKKFQSDLLGACGAHKGFVFVTNQTLSPGHRKALADMVRAVGKEVDILHLQRLQSLLDQPTGYGVRIQYLGIAMSIEDQLSWASESDNQTSKALNAHTRELAALRASVDHLSAGQKAVLRTMVQLAPSLPTPDLISVSSFTRADNFVPISQNLDPGLVLLFHRLACFDLPTRAVGRLRTSEVWLGDVEGRRAEHVQPPPAEELEQKLIRLCEEWRADFPRLRNRDEKLRAVTKFHARFLVLHPFFDGNGRAARAILMQQCLDLFGRADMTLMNKGADYYYALKSADEENFDPLIALMQQIIQ